MAVIDADTALAVRQRAECLYDYQQLGKVLDSLAASISQDLANNNPVMLCVMTGAVVTVSELLRRITIPLELDYIHASRYGDSLSGADLQWRKQPESKLAGRHVLIVDDIFDEGATMACLADYCREQGATQVSTVVLVEKRHDRKLVEFRPDYIGLEVDDVYVFGFGMDYRGYWRNLDGIYAAAAEDYR